MLQPGRNRLRRFYGRGDLHFITTSCYRRKPLLGSALARDRTYEFEGRGNVNMEWMFPSYMGKKTRVRRFGVSDPDDPELMEPTHPAKSAQSAAPTARYRKRKSKP
jgi:hypothetical protein